ncbi:MAG: D-alanyl-D-alanine dipeptidase [bacterium ADurb.Bin363]|nr:MAG: D-alanyl-D-alanine dipeptidase [bacterium ADurb.Bin363]
MAKKLLKVQKKLKKIGLGLKIWDAYRPLSVQYKFWELVPDLRYVADPKVGSNHNRGAAVDVTLVDSKGKELPMPTEFDDFTEKAGRNYNKLPKEVIKNRKLLEDYMVSEGFLPLPTEWWHFDYKNIKDYPVLDIPLEEVKSEK